jgi:hypothetical protein
LIFYISGLNSFSGFSSLGSSAGFSSSGGVRLGPVISTPSIIGYSGPKSTVFFPLKQLLNI